MRSTTLKHHLLAGIAASLAAGPFAAAPALAAPIQQAQTVNFDIPAGPLDGALQAFAAQSGRQLAYSPQLVAGLRSPGLKARLAPDQALGELLRGLPIDVRRGANALVLKPRGGMAASGAPADPFDPAAAGPPAETAEVEALVVTGSLIRGAGQGPSPVITFDRDAIDKGGHANLAEALAALPQNFGGGATPTSQLLGSDRTFVNDSAATGVNLRGLGNSATLVLINGRRMAGTGLKGNFADVSAIPTGAIGHVDVLLDGASALYGADAVGGVVNVFLRQDFKGSETRFRSSVTQGGDAQELQFGHTFGAAWSSGHAVVSAEYYQRDPLSSLSRDQTASSDLRPLGGTDHRVQFSNPGNIVAYSAAAGAYVPLYAIPSKSTGLTPADFVAGTMNKGDPRSGADTLPKQERTSLYATVSQSLGGFELSADALYSRRRYSYLQGGTSTILTVNRANPNFVSVAGESSQLIAYDFIGALGQRRLNGTAQNLGLSAGATRDFGRTWRAEAYAAFSADEGTRLMNNALNSGFLREALGSVADDPATSFSAARDGYFNPYGDGANNAKVVTDFINSGYQRHWRRNRVSSVNLKVDGTLLELPGGPLKLAAGGQLRHEDFLVRNTYLTSGAVVTNTDGALFDRDVGSAFAELRVPLIGPHQEIAGARRLELSVAGRIERYSDFGVTRNPKVGVLWEPVQGVTLRTSYGTSFRAPTLADLYEPYLIGATFVPDTSGSTLSLIQTGGNLALEPETAKSWTTGIDLAPPGRPGVKLGVTYFDTRFSNQVGHPVYEDILNALKNPIYAAFVRRLSASNATDMADAQALIDASTSSSPKLFPATAYGAIIDARNLNAGELDVRGLDVTGQWPLAVGGDRVELTANLSYLFEYSRKISPTAPSTDFVDLAGFPIDLRAVVGASWTHGPFTTSLSLRYADDYEASSGARIGSWTTADAQLRWTSPSRDGFLSDLSAGLVVQNLLGTKPPFYDSPDGVGYDPTNADVLGRTVAIQLSKRW
ncbi:TonB-dependent receptor [Caulobacter sp. UNC358MFTsu5.1]|uniref:TonB-dependent receptor n=1 Tax=Caulobacter sp. UNC358MFTsu5.1 TaxID=1449049 RepID=UPI0004A6E31F|nr:TonB-dependent receptor [Caulobacter sp. UNC358MFTsu5.1]